MTAPVILVDGNRPRPNGTEGNSTFALDTASVALTLQDTSQIGSVTWALASAPPGATTALGSASPAAPFSTTLGPLDKVGTYIFNVTTDAGESEEVAIAVLTQATSQRIPAETEKTQWSPTNWWFAAYYDLALAVDRAAGIADWKPLLYALPSNYANVSTIQSEHRAFELTQGSAAAGAFVQLYWPASVTGLCVVRNSSTAGVTCGHGSLGSLTGDVVFIAPGQTRAFLNDGTNCYALDGPAIRQIDERVDVTFASATVTLDARNNYHRRIRCTGATGGASRDLEFIASEEVECIVFNVCADSIVAKTDADEASVTIPTGESRHVFVIGNDVLSAVA